LLFERQTVFDIAGDSPGDGDLDENGDLEETGDPLDHLAGEELRLTPESRLFCCGVR
jgi:hypothetical protein